MVATKRAGLLLAVLAVLVPVVAAHGAELRGLISFAGRNVKWGEPVYGTGAEITYAFLHQSRSFPGARNCAEMLPIEALTVPAAISDSALRAAARQAAQIWSGAALLSFREIADPERADILIGAQNGARGVAFTNVSRDDRSGPLAPLTRASICLDPSERWSAVADGDAATYDLPRVIVHEMGHAIGLDHQGRDSGIMGYAYIERPELRLSPSDVAAVTRLYGDPSRAAQAALSDPSERARENHPAACAAVERDTVECGLTRVGGGIDATADPGH